MKAELAKAEGEGGEGRGSGKGGGVSSRVRQWGLKWKKNKGEKITDFSLSAALRRICWVWLDNEHSLLLKKRREQGEERGDGVKDSEIERGQPWDGKRGANKGGLFAPSVQQRER